MQIILLLLKSIIKIGVVFFFFSLDKKRFLSRPIVIGRISEKEIDCIKILLQFEVQDRVLPFWKPSINISK